MVDFIFRNGVDPSDSRAMQEAGTRTVVLQHQPTQVLDIMFNVS